MECMMPGTVINYGKF